ncbi:hypothetical protein [Wenxinia marina]|uniref:Excalibur calcium-binding domain protein n=1 Tax=Wenxinia marina DSM 24838 TaxID=1123501 RepID=A0A0D0Q191_9RHOB|nr:hypothetical protein [Wenxinia marina]KIQ68344.1 hypothetical protein Wenmar_02991 [Wenxinia marina DSM 24838]GGL72919.1 hypothetical protein GCM10011392_29450 [Wenxinia marina]
MTGTAKIISAALAAALLAGCAPSVPDSGRGVGYSDYSLYELERARREAELQSAVRPTAAPPVAATPSAAPTAPGGISSADLAAAGIGPAQTLPSAAPVSAAPLGTAPATVAGLDPNRTAGLQASPSNAAPASVNNGGISDTQNFDAVASRESIESDAARIRELAAQYEVVQPTALPQRADAGPNIIQYALNAPNRRGQEWYSRSIFHTQARFERNCSAYRSPDDAQRDFLSRGGPERDSLGIDPDGDGFACGWDPAPFRAAVGQG